MLRSGKLSRYFRKASHIVIVSIFFISIIMSPSHAQLIGSLGIPAPHQMISLTGSFEPAMLRGLVINPDEPFSFQFLVTPGRDNQENTLVDEGMRMVRYFMAALTTPQDEMWVNLSPYEEDRIIPEVLGKTQMGRDLLAQDYLLKQLSASLLYPENELGKKFWKEVYAQAFEKFGTTDVPVDTFHKVWIMPKQAEIFVRDQTAIIADSHLQVMMEDDYLAISHQPSVVSQNPVTESRKLTTVSSDVMRSIILPAIEREVNQGAHFAPLRQIFSAMILAEWYKRNLKESLLAQAYVDQHKIDGINLADPQVRDKIYAQYVEAYKKGLYSFVREDFDERMGETIPRKYFSGGVIGDLAMLTQTTNIAALSSNGRAIVQGLPESAMQAFDVEFQTVTPTDAAMSAQENDVNQSAKFAIGEPAVDGDTETQLFIARKVQNPFWTNMQHRARQQSEYMLDFDPQLIEQLIVQPRNVTSSWNMLGVAKEDVIYSKRFFHARVANNHFKGTPKGGIRWVTASHLLTKDEAFKDLFTQFIKLNPTKNEVETFIAKWLIQESKALALGMTLKTAGLDLRLGGGKGAVFIGDIVRDKNGAWTLEDWEIEKDVYQASVARGHARYLAEAYAVGARIDSPAPDVNTSPEIMALYNDEVIRVMVEMGPKAFEWNGKKYEDLYNSLSIILNVIDSGSFGITDTPFLDDMNNYFLSHYRAGDPIPVPWLAIFTGKNVEQGGLLGRKEATGAGVVDVLTYVFEYQQKEIPNTTVAVQGFGNVGRYAVLEAVRKGFKVTRFSDYKIALVKEDGFTEEDIINMINVSDEQKLPLYFLWTKDHLNKKGVTAILDDEEQINEAVLYANVDVLIPAALEMQIREDNVGRIQADMIIEGANGPTSPVAEVKLFERGIDVIPDTLANAAGVGLSGQEIEQAISGQPLTMEEAIKRRRDMLKKAVELTLVEKSDQITFREAFDRSALKNVARARMQRLIETYDGVVQRIRLHLEPGVSTDLVVQRIDKLGLLGFWLDKVEKGYEEAIILLKEKLEVQYDSRDITRLINWFDQNFSDTKNHHTFRNVTSFMKMFDGETIEISAHRLHYAFEDVAALRQRVLNEVVSAYELGELDVSETFYNSIVGRFTPLAEFNSDKDAGDNAMQTQIQEAFTKGGIDLNADYLDLRQQGDGPVINVPAIPQDLKSLQLMPGLYPVLLNVTPVNAPMLLGLDLAADSNSQKI